MIQGIKSYFSYLIYRTMGTASLARRLEWRRVLQWLNPGESEKILDIACGLGELSLAIGKRGSTVYGIDLSEDAIEFARSLAKRVKIAGDFRVGDAEKLPYPDGHFDKVVCSSSLEHFQDGSQALSEMRRVLKPDGRLVITVDSFTCPISDELKNKHREICSVVHYYTREELGRNINDAGLEIYRSEYLLTSPLTSLFFKLWIKYQSPQFLWLLVAFIGYPLLLISEKLSGRPEVGYTLIAEAVKAS